MLRGCRWQALLFLLAGLSLAAGLVWRASVRTGADQQNDGTRADPTQTTSSPDQTPATIAFNSVAVGDAGIPTFREGLVGSLSHVNPLLAAPGSLEAEVGGLIFEGLLRLNNQGEPVPDLAAGMAVTASGLEYVVTLREDVLWQDGVPFTATDVKFTLSLLQAQDFPGDPDGARFWRTVEVDVLAANALRFRLSQPLGSFCGPPDASDTSLACPAGDAPGAIERTPLQLVAGWHRALAT